MIHCGLDFISKMFINYCSDVIAKFVSILKGLSHVTLKKKNLLAHLTSPTPLDILKGHFLAKFVSILKGLFSMCSR
jgi:hypothetical protein